MVRPRLDPDALEAMKPASRLLKEAADAGFQNVEDGLFKAALLVQLDRIATALERLVTATQQK